VHQLGEEPRLGILIVGHGESVASTFYYFLDLPATARATVAIAAHHAALTTWAEQPLSWTRPEAGWRWTLMDQNDTSHLAPVPCAASGVD